MPIRALSAFFIRVNEIERTIAFYTKLLGVTFARSSPKVAIAKLGDLTIVIQESEKMGLTTAISFSVDNLDEIINMAISEGGTVNQGRTEGPLGTVANLTDPDGNPLEFVQLR